MTKVTYSELVHILDSILKHYDFDEKDAKLCAEIFAENTLVGVASHGLNKIPLFVELLNKGYIDPHAKPALENSFNAFEQWNGNFGAGPLNAHFISIKTTELAEKFGIGCIALKNNNHWMRPGYYAWQAAQKGYIFICWTNTIPNMPPWGAKTSTTGNNPIVFAVPGKDYPVLLDMALSQFAYGKLESYIKENKELPFDGGYNAEGNLTKNPQEIWDSLRPLPVGYWKGAGLSLLLDLIATILSGGKATFNLAKENIDSGASQIFIAIKPQVFFPSEMIEKSVTDILNYYLSAEKIGEKELTYPGKGIAETRKENLKNGIPVNDEVWQEVLKLQSKI